MVEWSSLTLEGKSHVIRTYCTKGSSAGQVVKSLADGGVTGATRNAVIGYVQRSMKDDWKFGAPNRQARIKLEKVKKPVQKSNFLPEYLIKKPTTKPQSPKKKAALDLSNQVHFLDADNSQCKYALWGNDDDLDHKFYCGAPKVRGIYCEYHANICFDNYYKTKRKAAWTT